MRGGAARVVTIVDDDTAEGESGGGAAGVELKGDEGRNRISRGRQQSVVRHQLHKPKKDHHRSVVVSDVRDDDNTFRRRPSAAVVLDPLPKKALASDSEKMKKIFQMLRWHPLEPGYHGGVPYVINFYYYLWAVDEVFNRPMLGVHIPDTIIVQKGSPAHWFFTEEKTMRVLMKDDEFTKDKQYVLSALTQRAGVSQQACSVAAMFIPIPDKGASQASVSYLSAKDLKEMFSLNIMPDGMLQRFVAPVGRYNVELRAKVGKGRQLNLERYQSLLRITDRVMGGTDDASGDDSVSVTWESSPVQANPLFSTRIGKITNGLLRNLPEISEGHDPTDRMKTMTIHFKNDTEGKLWLLWLSNIDWKEDRHDIIRRKRTNKVKKSIIIKTNALNHLGVSLSHRGNLNMVQAGGEGVSTGEGTGTGTGTAHPSSEGMPTPTATGGGGGGSSADLNAASAADADTNYANDANAGGDEDRGEGGGGVATGGLPKSMSGSSITSSSSAAGDKPKWDNSKKLSGTLYENNKVQATTTTTTSTPAEIVGDRHNCFMTETTLSRQTKTRQIYAKPHGATFAGKRDGEALRFGAMMQLSQRARQEAARRAAEGGVLGGSTAAAAAGVVGGDGANGGDQEENKKNADDEDVKVLQQQLSHVKLTTGKLIVSSTKSSGGMKKSTRTIYGSRGVTLPHIHSHNSKKKKGGGGGGGGGGGPR